MFRKGLLEKTIGAERHSIPGGMVLAEDSGREVVKGIEGNFVEFFRYWGSSPFVEMKDTNDLRWIDSGVKFPLFNHVFHTKLRCENPQKEILDTLSHFRERNLPVLWSVFPSSEPRNLRDRLETLGLNRLGDKPGMAMNVEDLKEDRRPLPKLKIDIVESEEDLARFVDVTAKSFDVAGSDSRTFLKILSSLVAKSHSVFACYLGCLDRQPVATGVLFKAADVSGVYWIGTIPEARGKGIGTRMTRRIMTEGKESGYSLAVLQATDIGEPVYKRMGFRRYLSYTLFSSGASR